VSEWERWRPCCRAILVEVPRDEEEEGVADEVCPCARTAHPNGYPYSWFWERYRAWRGQLDVVMRQIYRAGEKAFVDYAGPKVPVVDRGTGEVRDAMVFVGVLGPSLADSLVGISRIRTSDGRYGSVCSSLSCLSVRKGLPRLLGPLLQ